MTDKALYGGMPYRRWEPTGGGRSRTAKLTPARVWDILNSDRSDRDEAERYEVSVGTIQAIRRRAKWLSVDPDGDRPEDTEPAKADAAAKKLPPIKKRTPQSRVTDAGWIKGRPRTLGGNCETCRKRVVGTRARYKDGRVLCFYCAFDEVKASERSE